MSVEISSILQTGHQNKVKECLDGEDEQCPWIDVCFSVGKDGKIFKGVKALFAMHSPVFKAMLFGKMKEGNLNANGSDLDSTIDICDVTPNAFKFLIEYVNGLNPTIVKENAVDILYLSKKYLIEAIENACIKTLQNEFEKLSSIEATLNSLNQMYKLSLDDALIEMAQSIALDPKISVDLINSNTFLTLPPSILKVFLQSDKFGVAESIIFERCVEWAEYQSKLANGIIKASDSESKIESKNDDNDNGNDDDSTATTQATACVSSLEDGKDDEKSVSLEIDFNIDDNSDSNENNQQNNNNAKTKNDFFNLIKHCIRFPILNGKYFNGKVIDSLMLTTDECLDILRYIEYKSESDHVKTKVESIWNCNVRRDGYIFMALGNCNNSKIGLTDKEISKLGEFIPNEYRKYKWNLLFRASDNNFQASKFHDHCNGKALTITFVKSKQYKNIFGGFATAAWHSSSDYISDANAFIFLLRRENNTPEPENDKNKNITIPAKWKVRNEYVGNALYGNSSYGPTFGGGFELYVSDGCHANTSSYTSLGTYYDIPTDTTLFSGTYQFEVEEYEVWQLVQ